MKKIILYIIIFVLICFALPILFTNNKVKDVSKEIGDNLDNSNYQNDQKNLNDNISSDSYDYKEYNKIKLLHVKTGEIEELNLDEYICSVVAAEMPANYDIEALKAQAVVARTYTIYKIKNDKR